LFWGNFNIRLTGPQGVQAVEEKVVQVENGVPVVDLSLEEFGRLIDIWYFLGSPLLALFLARSGVNKNDR